MKSEIDDIEEQLVKLEAELAEATGEWRHSLENRIEELKNVREEFAAAGDVVLASGDDDPLLDEITEARLVIDSDIP